MDLKILSSSIILLLSIFGLNMQQNEFDYTSAWKEVDQLIEKQLPKSALEKIEDIYNIAQKEENYLQLTKSIFYKSKVILTTEEDGVEKIIEIYKNEIPKSKTPYKEILQSNLAGFYLEYFNNNRYIISQRTEVSIDEDANVRTMSTQSFIEKINSLYLASVADPKSLLLPTGQFKELLLEGYNEAGLARRPQLYDVLGDKVINYLSQGDLRPTLPSDKFVVNNELYFAAKDKFVNLPLSTPDNLSPQYQILVLYQNLLKNHKDGSSADITTDVSRLEYLNNNFSGNSTNDKYLAALISLSQRAKGNEEYSNVAYNIAQAYNQKSDFDNKFKAIEWCEKGIRAYPKSNGAISCQNLSKSIKKSEISVAGKEAYLIKTAFKLNVSYRNVPKAQIKLFKLEKKDYVDAITTNDREIESYLTGKKPVKLWEEKLNDTAYINHTNRLNISPLDNGFYVICVSDKSKGGIDNYLSFTVTNLSYVNVQKSETVRILVANRNSGEAIKGANVIFYNQEYDYNSRKQILRRFGNGTTDSKGLVAQPNSDRSLKILIEKGEDYFMPQLQIYSRRAYANKGRKSIEIFTDRAIYRPGQTILFKGLVLEYDSENIPSIIVNEATEVTLRNANYQEVAKSKYATNNFGSIDGSFTIPLGALTGTYSLQTKYGARNIKVEEYKRPTFEVKFDTLKPGLALGDAAEVTGKALGLAGNSISNSKVEYTVYRQLFYPRFCYYFPYNQGKEMVTNGETTTDDSGGYKIEFATKKENTEGIRGIGYSYTVEVNVVDPSGESRQATKYVSLLDTDFRLDIDNEEEIDLKDGKSHMQIYALNSEGSKQTIKGSYQIINLIKAEEESINEDNNRYYNNSNPYQNWKEGKLIQTGAFTSGQDISLNKLEVGVYLIKATAKDSKNTEVKATSYLVVKDSKNGFYPKTQLLFTDLNANSFQPSESLKATIGTSDSKVHSYYILTRGSDILKEGWLDIKSNAVIDYKIVEQDRGGLQLMLVAIKDNKPFTKQIQIAVPWTNKDLDIKFESFRDKLEPGQKEQYNITITPKQGKISESEVLMTMYDASLDQFVGHSWKSSFYPSRYQSMMLIPGGFNTIYGYQRRGNNNDYYQEFLPIIFPELQGFEGNRYYGLYNLTPRMLGARSKKSAAHMDGERAEVSMMAEEAIADTEIGAVVSDASNNEATDVLSSAKDDKPVILSPRTNLNETVFFYPTIYTDATGKVTINYTMNDALTKWKLMTLTHTTDLKIGYDERFLTTSKDIMIQPNSPRFIRLGDELWFSARVSNMTNIDKEYDANLSLQNDIKGEIITKYITNKDNTTGIIKANQTIGVAWKLEIPLDADIDIIRYITSVTSGNKSDAEQNYLPVLTNKFLVIETMAMYVNGKQTKTFDFKPLNALNTSGRINKNYTVEYTSNPVWFAIQALPYLKSVNNPSTTALVNQYFANSLGKNIIVKNPLIQQVFDIWRKNGAEALKSSLQKNSELKTMVLEETPWVMDALNEEDQKANIARFFDQNTLANELNAIESKIKERQTSNGGYTWIPGGRDSEHITLYVLETFGKLNKIGITNDALNSEITRALTYSDSRSLERYNKLITQKSNMDKYQPSYFDIYHLNIRSYFENQKIEKSSQIAYDFYTKQSIKYWNNLDVYSQALLGQYLYRLGNSTYKDIRKSLLERSFYSDDLGRYWNTGNGYTWNELPIERHDAIIDFLVEIGEDAHVIDELKIWLLKNKQTNNWKTDKATASAVYTLIEKGSKKQADLKSMENVSISVGGENISENTSSEKGTGYLKKAYKNYELVIANKNITIDNKSDHITWGGVYYQYLDDVSNIKGNTNGPLKITKELYKVVTSSKGEELVPIKDGSTLHPGDQLASRIIIVSDRNMNYIDIKDMRGAGVEPSSTLSKYYWKGGLSYYHSIRDLSDNYFIENLSKGTHVFEQRQRIVHKGKYSSGLATIQSSYAPEFGSNSKGFMIEVN